jgi:hypothetical protein
MSLALQVDGTKRPFEKGALQANARPNAAYVQPMPYLKQVYRQYARTCRVFIRGAPRGTGFLIAPTLVLTCFHVAAHGLNPAQDLRTQALDAEVRFSNLNGLEQGQGLTVAKASKIVAFSPPCAAELVGAANPESDAVYASPDELDYAILELDKSIGTMGAGMLQSRGWQTLPDYSTELGGSASLMVCHQPGQDIVLSIDTEPGARPVSAGRRFAHHTRTEPGSSGSLVQDLDGTPIAMHNYAWELAAPNGEAHFLNQGVPLDLIRAHAIEKFSDIAPLLNAPSPVDGWENLPRPWEIDESAAYIYKTAHDYLHECYMDYQQFYVVRFATAPYGPASGRVLEDLKRAVQSIKTQCAKIEVLAARNGYANVGEIESLLVAVTERLRELDAEGLSVTPDWQEQILCIYATIIRAMSNLDLSIGRCLQNEESERRKLWRLHALWSDVIAGMDSLQADMIQYPASDIVGRLASLKREGVWIEDPALAPRGRPTPAEALAESEERFPIAALAVTENAFASRAFQRLAAEMSRRFGNLDHDLLQILRPMARRPND